MKVSPKMAMAAAAVAVSLAGCGGNTNRFEDKADKWVSDAVQGMNPCSANVTRQASVNETREDKGFWSGLFGGNDDKKGLANNFATATVTYHRGNCDLATTSAGRTFQMGSDGVIREVAGTIPAAPAAGAPMALKP